MKKYIAVLCVVLAFSPSVEIAYGESIENEDLKINLTREADGLRCDTFGLTLIRFALLPDALCIKSDQIVSYNARRRAHINVELPREIAIVSEMMLVRPRVDWHIGSAFLQDLGQTLTFYNYREELEVVASSLQPLNPLTELRASSLSTDQIKAMPAMEFISRRLGQSAGLKIYQDSDQSSEITTLAICQLGTAGKFVGKTDCVYFMLTQSFIIEVQVSKTRINTIEYRSAIRNFVIERLVGRGFGTGGSGVVKLEIRDTRLAIPVRNFNEYNLYGPVLKTISLDGEVPHDEEYFAPSLQLTGRRPGQDRASVNVSVFLGEHPGGHEADSRPETALPRKECKKNGLKDVGKTSTRCTVSFEVASDLRVEYTFQSVYEFDLDHIDATIRGFVDEIIQSP